MKLFECPNCGNILYFENTRCERCGSQVGYDPSQAVLAAIEPTARFRPCSNAQYSSCNWLVPADDTSEFCAACRHNRTIPDLSVPENLAKWRLYEQAKHRLFYTLLGLPLPLKTRAEDPENGLAFDFLAETPETPKVITGHDHGLITLNLNEADDSHRADARQRLNEPYRTLLGHLRHESGHYAWGCLVKGEILTHFREMFGDETQDYAEALRNHYAKGSNDGWRASYISAYAASHPWEDFAETWAHYLHMADTMEMAAGFGVCMKTGLGKPPLKLIARAVPVEADNYPTFVNDWAAFTVVMNSLNECMGQPDMYPFVLPSPVIAKLEFIHRLVRMNGPSGSTSS